MEQAGPGYLTLRVRTCWYEEPSSVTLMSSEYVLAAAASTMGWAGAYARAVCLMRLPIVGLYPFAMDPKHMLLHSAVSPLA
jgi:hypothetical protein